MKKTAAGLCILLAAGMVTACGGKKTEQTTAAVTTVAATEATTAAAETTNAEITDAETVAEEAAEGAEGSVAEEAAVPEENLVPESADSADGEAVEIETVSGEVKAVGMSAITIVTESGEELSFLKEGTEVDIADGLKEGIFVTVTYKNTEEGQVAVFITDAIEP